MSAKPNVWVKTPVVDAMVRIIESLQWDSPVPDEFRRLLKSMQINSMQDLEDLARVQKVASRRGTYSITRLLYRSMALALPTILPAVEEYPVLERIHERMVYAGFELGFRLHRDVLPTTDARIKNRMREVLPAFTEGCRSWGDLMKVHTTFPDFSAQITTRLVCILYTLLEECEDPLLAMRMWDDAAVRVLKNETIARCIRARMLRFDIKRLIATRYARGSHPILDACIAEHLAEERPDFATLVTYCDQVINRNVSNEWVPTFGEAFEHALTNESNASLEALYRSTPMSSGAIAQVEAYEALRETAYPGAFSIPHLAIERQKEILSIDRETNLTTLERLARQWGGRSKLIPRAVTRWCTIIEPRIAAMTNASEVARYLPCRRPAGANMCSMHDLLVEHAQKWEAPFLQLLTLLKTDGWMSECESLEVIANMLRYVAHTKDDAERQWLQDRLQMCVDRLIKRETDLHTLKHHWWRFPQFRETLLYRLEDLFRDALVGARIKADVSEVWFNLELESDDPKIAESCSSFVKRIKKKMDELHKRNKLD